MDILSWYKKRGIKFLLKRGEQLLTRYDFRSNQKVESIRNGVKIISELGCMPTMFTPGVLLKQEPELFRYLQALGAEIGVHSYNHINLDHLPIDLAAQQLIRAVKTFDEFDIKSFGFRCPYLGYNEELLNSLSKGLFEYSSNDAIFWDGFNQNEISRRSIFYNTLEKYYKPKSSREYCCVPITKQNFIEIPLCVPDDLQLHDGLYLSQAGITQVWMNILDQTYKRGEHFNLIFHTELFAEHINSFIPLVEKAKTYRPLIWIAKVHEISEWWREKSAFTMDIETEKNGLRLTFYCSPRGTILVRGLNTPRSAHPWDEHYQCLHETVIVVPDNPRPFIGINNDIPENIIIFLKNQGYIIDNTDTASSCGLFLDKQSIRELTDEIKLINYIESSPAPLVRFGRWPNAAKSALSITGDLDAFSLIDYFTRIFSS